ncbi:MAG: metalloregulator ArsR/SmtB family transcription factor [Bryobacteraceae bacterium]|nr:metalloregulator ArsR/SmtB family transcription factor [Bryobacteraceae bacterium]
MPARILMSKELANLFGVLSSPHRVRIVEELRNGEVDVNGLKNALQISHSHVSQHLAVLRTQRLVTERRQGRHVFYRLTQPRLAEWILEGLTFIEQGAGQAASIKDAVEQVRAVWGADAASAANGHKTGGAEHS